MNILMALADFIPVILYTASVVILQRYLYDKMSKGVFAIYCAGTMMVSVGGFFKAIWKFLYAANICDFDRLNQSFFPLQSVGFILAGLAMIAKVCHKQDRVSVNAHTFIPVMLTAPALFTGTFIFVFGNLFGTITMNTILSIDAKKQHKPFAIVMFVLSAISLILMGYLSSKDFTDPAMNWLAEGVNTFGMICYLFGAIKLSRKA